MGSVALSGNWLERLRMKFWPPYIDELDALPQRFQDALWERAWRTLALWRTIAPFLFGFTMFCLAARVSRSGEYFGLLARIGMDILALFGTCWLRAWLVRHRLRELLATWKWCWHCGYDLTGNVSGTCPECGTARRVRLRNR